MQLDTWQITLGLVAILGLLFSHVLRSPKEQVRILEARVQALETSFDTLSIQYAGNHGRHDQALSQLTIAVQNLTNRFDQFMSINANGPRRG